MSKLVKVVLLAAMCAVSGVWAQTPTHIWGGNGNLVTGLTNSSVVEIRTGASGTLTVPAGAEISIISNGTVTNTSAITLDIGANARVVWTASLTLNATVATMTVNGTGNLSIEGGQVRNLNTTSGIAIAITSNLTGTGTIAVSGGEVSSNTLAIYNNSTGTVTISGTALITSAVRNPATATIDNGAGGTINVQGGTVRNTAPSANAHAIMNHRSTASTINVSGGEVSAIWGSAIHRNGGTVNITGGLIIAQNTVAVGANGVVNAFNTHTGGVIIARPFSDTYLTGSITSGGSQFLAFEPSTAPVSWNFENDIVTGIRYNATGDVFPLSMTAVESSNIAWNNDNPSITLGAATTTVTIAQGAAGTLLVPEGAEISIISDGAVTNTNTIALNIGTNAKVIWTADLTLNATASTMIVDGTGNLSIEGGQVRNTSSGNAISSNMTGTGTIAVSGGVVSSTTSSGVAIHNGASGTIIVSDNAIVTSTNWTSSTGTIHNQAGGRINVVGGTVENTNSLVIYNASWGEVTVSGGTVSATTGRAIHNNSTGTVTISGNALITSASVTGAIIHNQAGGRINVVGGTVENTAANANAHAIYNNGAGFVVVSSGVVSANTGIAIHNNSTGTVTISENAIITSANGTVTTGTIHNVADGTINVQGGTVRNTAASVNASAIYNQGVGVLTISGGIVASTNWGIAIRNNSTGTVTISENAIVTSLARSSTSGTIHNNAGGRINVVGGRVENTFSNDDGHAIFNMVGEVTVNGGRVSAIRGRAIRNFSTGTVTISGDAIVTSASIAVSSVTIHNGAGGTINVQGGTVENTAPVTDARAIFNDGVGLVTVSGGSVLTSFGISGAIYNRLAGGTIIAKDGTISVSVGTEIFNQDAGGVIIRYNTDASRVSGTTDGLTVTGTGATAMWRLNSSAQGGILYRTDRFFAVPDVIVNKAEIAIPELAAHDFTYDKTGKTVSLSEPNTAYSITSGDTQTNAGTHQVTVSLLVDTDNYKWEDGDSEPIQLSWEIKPAPLTITGVTATNRAYNGEATVALVGGTLNGVIEGDIVNFTLGNGTMANKNADDNKAVTTNITLTGAAAGNYTLTQPTGISVNITPAPLTITGVSATNRAYNGETTVALIGGEIVGIIGSDEVTFTRGNGTMSDKNVGDNKAVATTIALTGAGASNYTLTQPTGITVNIAKANPTTTPPTTATANIGQTLADIATQLPAGWTWKEAGTTLVGEIGDRTHVAVFIPEDQENFNTLEANVTVTVSDPSSIRHRQANNARYGIVLEKAIVSDMARISVITPEPATVNLRIMDNLGNVVFTADGVGATALGRHGGNGCPQQTQITWNLTNQSGRYVANGTYLVVVEATGISGKTFQYSTRIGVNR